jgi:nitrite reductase/ring-hydroxylating ferredoxin subunit
MTISRYPFPTTFSGWYRILDSHELAVGAALPVPAFGRELVVFRGEDGRARAFDAHCPHLGAHLGHGGTIAGDGLRCPFHGWRFDSTGACVHVPYASKIPSRAQLRAWDLREVGGRMLAWYDAEGRLPAWEPPGCPELGHPEWDGPTRHRRTVSTHVLEVAENVVDPAHFLVLHGVATLPITETAADGPTFRSWSRLTQQTPRGERSTSIDAEGSGVGLWRVHFRGIVETLLNMDLTPIADNLVAIRLDFYVSRSGGSSAGHGVGAAMIQEIMHQLDQDIRIWEHKIYRTDPILCAGEAGIPAIRRWARSFYPKEHPPL